VTIFYSKSTSGFYSSELKNFYNASATWPEDAREISDTLHAELMAAQTVGHTIKAGENGLPVAVAPLLPTAEQLAAAARSRRDELLTASDWTQGRDVPDATAARWTLYRQSLRDLPTLKGFPESIAWPVSP